jgi:NitT/TauT family transport system permease protein
MALPDISLATRYRLLLLFVLLITWQLLGQRYPSMLSYPTRVMIAIGELFAGGALLPALVLSLRNLVVGWLIASVIGVALGLLLGRFRRLALMFEPFINALYSTPRVALVPLIVLWFGLSYRATIFVVVLMAVFPVIVMTLTGVRHAGRDYVEVARSFCMNESRILFKVVLPGALPYIGMGIRLGSGRAVTGMIVGEMFVRTQGIGTLLKDAELALAVDKMFAIILIIALIAICNHYFVTGIESRMQVQQPQAFE